MNSIGSMYFKITVFILVIFVSSFTTVYADRNGITGRTTSGCSGNGCHDQNSSTSVNISGLSSNTIYMSPNSTRSFSAIVSHSSQVRAGINIGVKNSSDNSVGNLTAGTGLKKPGAAELTHTGPQVMSNGQFSFNYTWQAPSATGTYYMRAAGNAVNNDNNSGGDSWSFMTQLTIIVANPSVVLVAPNGGEIACRNSQLNISWTPINLSNNVRLEYTTNGTNWTTIATVPTSPNFYLWTVPANIAIGSTYKIRVSDASTSSVNDQSNNNFTIHTVPTIITHPKNDSVCAGGSMTISVTTDNPTLYTYQWRRNGQNVTGATSANYVIPNAQMGQEGDYDVIVTGCSPVTSNIGIFQISSPPAFTLPPADTAVCKGTTATLHCNATGSILTYQWKKNGTNITGATSPVLNFPAVTVADTGDYTITVSGKCTPSQTSNPAHLRFITAPTVTVQPRDTLECIGQTAIFTVEATGSGLTYQWRKNGKNIENAFGNNYVINGVTAADASNYDVVITNSCDLVSTSKAAVLKIRDAVAITSQPRDTSVQTNLTATFSVSGSGEGISYQWMKNGTLRNADTLPTITIKNVKLSDSGSYKCIIKNACGQVESNIAKLTVSAPPAGAALAVSVSTVDFTCTKVKTTRDSTLTNVVFNGGGQPLNVTNVAITGNDAGEFSIVTGGGTFTLAPNEKRTLQLRFNPQTQSAKSASLEFTSNSTTTSPKLLLSGKGCLGKIENTVVFSMDSVLVSSKHDSVLKVCNTGDYPIIITSGVISGTNAVNYTINSSLLSNATIKPNDCLNVPISFTPTQEGKHIAELNLLIDGETIKMPLEGIGYLPVGIEENPANLTSVNVYPNPATGRVVFSGVASSTLPVHLRIFDALGNQIHQETNTVSTTGEFQIALNAHSELSAGNYSAVFTIGTNQIRTPFVIVR
ncbi:MAG: immunoglobulin domain-containing protein [Ignavibacteria bacterium]|nr:immunoglobulin domain-containing protein [Ignavibacteria bacterium]